MDMSKEFVLKSSANGGVVVTEQTFREMGRIPDLAGAFTTPVDMIAWLAEQYGLTASVAINETGVSYSLDNDIPATEALDGWINWNGGTCPVDPERPVVVRFKGGEEKKVFSAKDVRWHHDRHPTQDIVAYRLV